MNRQMTCGTSSISFQNPVFVQSCASVVSRKEGEGPLGAYFDTICEDPMFGTDTWEAAESTLQKQAALLAIKKNGLTCSDIQLLFAGDLLAQTSASSFGTADLKIPFYGLFGACSTMGESLSLGSMCIDGGYGKYILCATSSHFASAEKEFRFPLDYGSQRPLSATWTVTGSGAFVLGSEQEAENCKVARPRAKITGLTVGMIVDYGLKDSMNMGACMAPAAASTLERHFIDFNSQPEDYDKIITGDLGKVGQKVLFDLMKEKNFDISEQHMDCGMEIFDEATQDTHAGGSGCACSALMLSAVILPKLASGEWKRVLFVPTGALLSQVSANEGRTIPAIAHAVWLESGKE